MSKTDDKSEKQLLSPDEVKDTVARLAEEVAAGIDGDGDENTAFVGILTRGVTLAQRVASALQTGDREFPVGILDISLYRDDLDLNSDLPKLESSQIPFSVDGARVVLFDDVIYTGRTIRAALDEISDFGRPAKVELAVLVDRGWREIPIQPDYAGRHLKTEQNARVSVRLEEDDGEDGVFLMKKTQSQKSLQ